jgi:hypothetical protein
MAHQAAAGRAINADDGEGLALVPHGPKYHLTLSPNQQKLILDAAVKIKEGQELEVKANTGPCKRTANTTLAFVAKVCSITTPALLSIVFDMLKRETGGHGWWDRDVISSSSDVLSSQSQESYAPPMWIWKSIMLQSSINITSIVVNATINMRPLSNPEVRTIAGEMWAIGGCYTAGWQSPDYNPTPCFVTALTTFSWNAFENLRSLIPSKNWGDIAFAAVGLGCVLAMYSGADIGLGIAGPGPGQAAQAALTTATIGAAADSAINLGKNLYEAGFRLFCRWGRGADPSIQEQFYKKDREISDATDRISQVFPAPAPV